MKKSSVSDRMAKVENRLGKTTGVSKGYTPAPPAKVKPILGKNKIGVKVTRKF
jgi:hypothetical protein